MNWITKNIAIGNYLDAKNILLLKEEKIKAILSLDGSTKASSTSDLGVKKIETYRLIDGAGNDLRVFQRAVDELERLVEKYKKVLVHCHAGKSRSVVITAGYLMKAKHLEADEALAKVTALRKSQVSPELVDLLYLLV